MERLDIYSLQEYNDIMRRKLIARNSKDYSKKLGSRTSIFEAEEKQYDCAFYSVPIRYVGKKVTVKATNEQIRIYYKEKLIAEHRRAVRKWQKSTLEAHIPGKGTDLHGAYSSDELISWAEKFGPYTVRWVKAELGRFEFEVQAYRPVTSVLRILNRYTPEAAESASEAALASSVFTVKGYKSILSAQSRIHPAKANRINLNDVFCAHEDKEGSDYGNS